MLNKEKILNTIIYGDCLRVLSGIPDESIDLIVTSPPYNLKINYASYSDDLPLSEYYAWCRDWMRECFRVLKVDGRFCLNHYLAGGMANAKYFPLMDLYQIAKDIGYGSHSIAIWNDATLSNKTAWGEWLGVNCYISCPYEGILFLYKGNWVKTTNKGTTNIDKKEFMETCHGVWNIPTERCRDHPAPFPVKLAERCIKTMCYENNVVLDPFGGSGTTAVASINLNRNFVIIDNDLGYCEYALDRAQAVLNQPDLFIDNSHIIKPKILVYEPISD